MNSLSDNSLGINISNDYEISSLLKDRKSNRLRESIHRRAMMEKKLACREVFEAVVAAGRETERSGFRASGNGRSGSPSAGCYQETR
ncbi:hypothetical protein D5085_17535 [Ectothiorhodospiraceae bacterium BW-2]|nr:hypothetical protein D5085_17535 [Ectothiorhodospiraceae bacterium BW-2]